MSVLGSSLKIKGEVRSSRDLTIECAIEGPVTCEGGAVTITASSVIAGDVVAGDITVFGRSRGKLVATEVVDVRPDATVSGTIVSPRLILHDGARFNGHVDPHRADAAVTVARFQQRRRDGTSR